MATPNGSNFLSWHVPAAPNCMFKRDLRNAQFSNNLMTLLHPNPFSFIRFSSSANIMAGVIQTLFISNAIFLLLYSLTADNLPSSGSGGYVRTYPSSYPGMLSRTVTSTTSSPGLVKLVQERGIFAAVLSSSPNAHLHDDVKSEDEKRQKNIFSFNLIEKLRSVGLYKVVARGFIDSGKNKEGDLHTSSLVRKKLKAGL